MIIRHANTEHRAPAKPSQFTGRAVGDSILPATDGVIINTMTFEPGARTHWHSHEHGQILSVVTGYGLICTAGQAERRDRAWRVQARDPQLGEQLGVEHDVLEHERVRQPALEVVAGDDLGEAVERREVHA